MKTDRRSETSELFLAPDIINKTNEHSQSVDSRVGLSTV